MTKPKEPGFYHVANNRGWRSGNWERYVDAMKERDRCTASETRLEVHYTVERTQEP